MLLAFFSLKAESYHHYSNYSPRPSCSYGGYCSPYPYINNNLYNNSYNFGANGQIQLRIPPLGGYQYGYAGRSMGVLGAGLIRSLGEDIFSLFKGGSRNNNERRSHSPRSRHRRSSDDSGREEKTKNPEKTETPQVPPNSGTPPEEEKNNRQSQKNTTLPNSCAKSCATHTCSNHVARCLINNIQNGGTITEYDEDGTRLASCDFGPEVSFTANLTDHCKSLASTNKKKDDKKLLEGGLCAKNCAPDTPIIPIPSVEKEFSDSKEKSPCSPFLLSERSSDLGQCISSSQKQLDKDSLHECKDNASEPNEIECEEEAPSYGEVVAKAFNEITSCFNMNNSEKKNFFKILNHESRFHINALNKKGHTETSDTWSIGIGQITAGAIRDVQGMNSKECGKKTFDLKGLLFNREKTLVPNTCELISLTEDNLERSLYMSAMYLEKIETYFQPKGSSNALQNCKSSISSGGSEKSNALAGSYHSGFLGGLLAVCLGTGINESYGGQKDSAKKYIENIQNDFNNLSDKSCEKVSFLK